MHYNPTYLKLIMYSGSSVLVEWSLNEGHNVISLQRASLNATSIQMLMQYCAWVIFEKSRCN